MVIRWQLLDLDSEFSKETMKKMWDIVSCSCRGLAQIPHLKYTNLLLFLSPHCPRPTGPPEDKQKVLVV